MTRRMKSRWIVAGLCTLTAMVAGVNEAEADRRDHDHRRIQARWW